MTTPTENWPKPFMLQLHEQAVENGFVWVRPISEADADSLTKRLYRMRRRSDTSMAAFIRPEYHLVMVGKWEPGEDGTGQLPILYDKRADGQDLPRIELPTGEEAERYAAPPALAEPSPPTIVDLTTLDPVIKPGEIDGFVESLAKKAAARAAREATDGES